MLFTELKAGQSIMIGDAKVTLVKKLGDKARLSIDADKSIKIQYGQNKSNAKNIKQDAPI